ncbi:MAG: DNA double-strand break repair nuclease NurA [Anaerolineaceae bacterium]|nr:DNA double-strand break repair nuclease NurA [Anaerolineaceae bacterium]
MPVNFQEIQRQVKEMGRQAPQREKKLREKRQQAENLLQACSDRLEELIRRVEQAVSHNSALRCAVPVEESLTFASLPQPIQGSIVLLAADGSQVNPSRHDPVEFGVINIGAIRIIPGQAEPPLEITRSTLLYQDALYSEAGPLTEEIVALRRDLNERKMLAELAAKEELPVVALTDGPMELFREPKENKEFRESFKDYLQALRQLAGLQVSAAGYVDKPRADLVVRLLELMILSEDELSQAGKTRPLEGVTDEDLFCQLLQPGQRSAVFAIQSTSSKDFSGSLALHFFFLNVGRSDHPYVARVEVPQWVVQKPELLNMIHFTLVAQCLQMGNRPYPYALHRAHEVALVSFAEKAQLQDMIAVELLRQGVDAGQKSNKQVHKDQSGTRTRYK